MNLRSLWNCFCATPLLWAGLAASGCDNGEPARPPYEGGWSATYTIPGGGEEMEGIEQLASGNFVIVGQTDGLADDEGDLWLLEIDENGAVQWQQAIGGVGAEMGVEVRETNDGGLMLGGWTQASGAGGYDMWVVKLDSSHQIDWQKTYGGSGDEQIWSLVPTADGNFLMAGGTTSFGAGAADLWMLKIDPSGTPLWQKTYGGAGDDGGGGDYQEYVVRCLEDEDGNYLLGSETDSFGNGDVDIWLVKTDPDGAVIWEKAYGGADEDSMWSFYEATDGNYIIPGMSETYSVDGKGDTWIFKLDKDGNYLWQNIYGIDGTWDESLTGAPTADGGILSGSYYDKATDWGWELIRVDGDGNLLWQEDFDLAWDWPNTMLTLSNDDSLIAGVLWGGTPRPNKMDLWVTRVGPGGGLPAECDFSKELDLVEQSTEASVVDTNATVQDTTVVPQTSNATITQTTVEPSYQCGE